MLFKNNYLHCIILISFALLLTYEYNYFIQTDEVMIQSFSDKFTQEAINQILNVHHTQLLGNYIFVIISMFLSSIFIALVILLVVWIYYLDEGNFNIKFSDTWRIVLFAQWSSVAAMCAKICWFGFIHTNYTYYELASFYPLSIINFFDINKLAIWFLYPIQLINVFELIYWIILVTGIKNLLNRTWFKSFEMIFLSYGVILILWVIFIMFISLNISNSI